MLFFYFSYGAQGETHCVVCLIKKQFIVGKQTAPPKGCTAIQLATSSQFGHTYYDSVSPFLNHDGPHLRILLGWAMFCTHQSTLLSFSASSNTSSKQQRYKDGTNNGKADGQRCVDVCFPCAINNNNAEHWQVRFAITLTAMRAIKSTTTTTTTDDGCNATIACGSVSLCVNTPITIKTTTPQ